MIGDIKGYSVLKGTAPCMTMAAEECVLTFARILTG